MLSAFMIVVRLGFCAFGQCDILIPDVVIHDAKQQADSGHCHSANRQPEEPAENSDLAVCCIDEDFTQFQTIDLTFLNSQVLVLGSFELTDRPALANLRYSFSAKLLDFEYSSGLPAIPVLTQKLLI